MSAGNCARCGTYRDHLHGHHIVPRSEGGSDDPSNIEYICANCHEDEHKSPFGQRARAARRRAAREEAVPEARLREMYEIMTIRQIAAELGTAPSNVHFWMQDYGIKPKKWGRPSKPRPDESTLRRLYEEDMLSLQNIADRYGVTHMTVRSWLLVDGVPIRNAREAQLARGVRTTVEPPS